MQYKLNSSMEPSDPFPAMRLATFRRAYEDGIAEILTATLLASAAAILLRRQGVLILFLAIALNRALPRLRDRYTAPRTGVAQLPAPPHFLRGILLYSALTAAAVTLAAWLLPALGGYRWLPLFTGLLLSGGFLHVVLTARLKRFALYLAAASLGGLTCTLTLETGARLESYEALRTLLAGLAALLAISGTTVFLSFLHHNPVFPGDPAAPLSHGR